MALVVFLVIKAINSAKDKMEAAAAALMKKQEEEAAAEPPAPSKEEVLLTEIRDLLREQKKQ